MIETDIVLKFEDLKRAFDLTFQQPLVERGQELVHLLIVRIGTARFALKVADLAGLARAQTIVPIPGADSELLGIAGLKGRMVAVYSLAAMIGSPELSIEQNQWMVLCRCEKEIALAFTAVTGTMMVPRARAQPGKYRGAAPCNRCGRLGLVAVVAAERQLNRRENCRKDRSAGLRGCGVIG